LSERELWLIGAALYWAEGSKEKLYGQNCRLQFNNTDPDMIRFFLFWLQKIFNKTFDDLIIDLYIHDLQKSRTDEIVKFWIKTINGPENIIKHIYYKNGNPKTKRKNIGESYHGTLRISLKSSSSLNRQVAGWTQGVVKFLR
jgi:hypothetical protein